MRNMSKRQQSNQRTKKSRNSSSSFKTFSVVLVWTSVVVVLRIFFDHIRNFLTVFCVDFQSCCVKDFHGCCVCENWQLVIQVHV